MTDNYKKERFARWQKLTIQEMGKTINLFLGIIIATLGFSISYLMQDAFYFVNFWDYVFIMLGTGLLVVNIATLLILTWNRQSDLRATTKITKLKSENTDGANDEKISDLRQDIDALGRRTWFLYNTSLIVFSAAELLIVLGFAFHIVSKHPSQTYEHEIVTPLIYNLKYDRNI